MAPAISAPAPASSSAAQCRPASAMAAGTGQTEATGLRVGNLRQQRGVSIYLRRSAPRDGRTDSRGGRRHFVTLWAPSRAQGTSDGLRIASLLCSSAIAGLYYESGRIAAGLFLLTLVDFCSERLASTLLHPPFHDPRPPAEGHSRDPAKLCPYWPASTVCGPAGYGLAAKDVEVPPTGEHDGGCMLRGWLFEPGEGAKDRRALLIMAHG
jgi:hypothetical protein